MSVQAMARVWDLDLPHAERLVLLALADHADHVGDNIYPSIGLIAWKTGYSSRQVQRIIKSLVQMEILCVVDEPEGRTTVYRMDLKAGTVKEPYLRQNVRGDKMSGVTKGHTQVRQNVTPTPDIAMSPKPPVNHQGTTSGGERNNGTAAVETQRLSAEQQEYVAKLVEQGFDTPGQAEAAVAKQEFSLDLIDRLGVLGARLRGQGKNPVAIIWPYLKAGKLPNDLPAPPPPTLTEAEKRERYMADFYSKTVAAADYRSH